jgi:hypothetical protein
MRTLRGISLTKINMRNFAYNNQIIVGWSVVTQLLSVVAIFISSFVKFFLRNANQDLHFEGGSRG